MRNEVGTSGDGIDFQAESPDVSFKAGSEGREDGVRSRAVRLKEQALDKVSTRLDSQKSRATETLDGVAQALMVASQQLQNQDQNSVGPYVERLAHQVERVSGFVQETNVEEVMDDIGQFARRHPGLFVGGALMLGFMGARFLKSSERKLGAESIDDGYGTSRGYASSHGYVGSADTGYGRHNVSGGSSYGTSDRTPDRSQDFGDGSSGLGSSPDTGFRASGETGRTGYGTAG